MAIAKMDATDRRFDVTARGSVPGPVDAVLFHGVSLSMATAQEAITVIVLSVVEQELGELETDGPSNAMAHHIEAADELDDSSCRSWAADALEGYYYAPVSLKLAAEHATKIRESVISSESSKSTEAIGGVIITSFRAGMPGISMPGGTALSFSVKSFFHYTRVVI